MGLCHVRAGSDDLQEISNMTIINVALKLMGPTAENVLTQRLLVFQVRGERMDGWWMGCGGDGSRLWSRWRAALELLSYATRWLPSSLNSRWLSLLN
jgi:hypothetical protein